MSSQISPTPLVTSSEAVGSPVSERARDKLRSLLVIIAIFAVGGLSISLVFHNALGVRASIVVLVALAVGSIVARATRRI